MHLSFWDMGNWNLMSLWTWAHSQFIAKHAVSHWVLSPSNLGTKQQSYQCATPIITNTKSFRNLFWFAYFWNLRILIHIRFLCLSIFWISNVIVGISVGFLSIKLCLCGAYVCKSSCVKHTILVYFQIQQLLLSECWRLF